MATVERVDSAANLSGGSVDCRTATVQSDESTAVFARVWFRQGRHVRHWIVSLPNRSGIEVGDRLFVDVADCSVPAERVSR